MSFRRFRSRQSGFMLPLLAASMLALGSAATVVVVKRENVAFWEPKTESLQDLNDIKAALVGFQRTNHRLPCVASRTALPSAVGYGTELADCTPTGAASGGTVRLDIGGGNFLRIGALPHYTLKLPATAAEDRWSNRFTYAVIEKLVDPYQFTSGVGAIAIQNNAGGAIMGTAAWVVVSHGPDGKGAYGAKVSAIGKACNSSAGKDQGNCLDNDAIFRVADTETAAGVNFYDDIIAYDNVDAYAQTINRPCLRSALGDASWDNNTCTNNTWTNMLNLGAQAIVNTNTAAAAGSATLGCNNGTLTYSAASCNSHCAAVTGFVWGSPYNCQADIPAVNHGASSATINNVVAGRTGTVSAACNDGTATYTTACNPNSCSLPWGGSIAHGSAVTAYQVGGVACGGTCEAETRTCNYGTLSGSYTNQTCSSGVCGCTLPWGGSITHGSSTTAYTSNSVPCGGNCATVAQTRTCTDGTLSGSGDYGSCSVTPCLPCASPCGSIAHGANCTAYQAASVACGSSCTSETRNCNNGALSGSYTNASCSVSACAGCASPCGAIIHTGTCTAYLNASEPFGGSCTSQVRTCNNGALSGSYANGSCSVTPAAGCASPCGAIGHGGTCTAYLNATEPFGGSCSSQVRSCNNGALSGSYTNASCSVNPPAGCASPCGALAHGANCTAYLNATEPFGGSCTSQVRNCNNGTLSGSYAHANCTVDPGPSTCNSRCGVIANGATCTSYFVDAADGVMISSCADYSTTTTCNSGVMSGPEGDYASCTDGGSCFSWYQKGSELDFTPIACGAGEYCRNDGFWGSCSPYNFGCEGGFTQSCAPCVADGGAEPTNSSTGEGCCNGDPDDDNICGTPAPSDPCFDAGQGTGCLISGSDVGTGCIGNDVWGNGSLCCAGCTPASCAPTECNIADITSGCTGCVANGDNYFGDNVAPCKSYICNSGTWSVITNQMCPAFCDNGI